MIRVEIARGTPRLTVNAERAVIKARPGTTGPEIDILRRVAETIVPAVRQRWQQTLRGEFEIAKGRIKMRTSRRRVAEIFWFDAEGNFLRHESELDPPA